MPYLCRAEPPLRELSLPRLVVKKGNGWCFDSSFHESASRVKLQHLSQTQPPALRSMATAINDVLEQYLTLPSSGQESCYYD